MKFAASTLWFLVLSNPLATVAFSSLSSKVAERFTSHKPLHSFVSIGLGPEEDVEEQVATAEVVEYEIPNHEEYRTSRRSKVDEQCDAWFGSLLGDEVDAPMVLGSLAEDALHKLMTPVELKNDIKKPKDDEEWTPYVATKLPWTPLVPAFGLEEYGLPVPRRNAETWRHFDVVGMIETDYSGSPAHVEMDLELSEEKLEQYKASLKEKGGWLDDDACSARLVYVNGRFCSSLSKSTDNVRHVQDVQAESDEVRACLARLPDGFTDELAAPVPSGEDQYLTSYCKLSGPDHSMGDATGQFAVNVQQGTACFAALNTIRTGGVAYVHQPPSTDGMTKPVLVVNAITKDAGADSSLDSGKGVAYHPRALVVAEKDSKLSFVQSMVDLDDEDLDQHRNKLCNGYTQVFVKEGANVTHSFLEESGGIVTPRTELNDEEVEEGTALPREIEANRPELKDTVLEALDVHITGEDGDYTGTVMAVGGSGRVRVAMSVSLLRPGSNARVNGFCLSGGAQKCDVKTNIHHVAQGTSSQQDQRTMIGGRATGAFRGRIRVEQSAQQTNSEQLSRTILLSDRSRAWAVPSLEIIADDVQCAHGATVSDLSEEELFYLRSRGLDRAMSRNLLMYAFAGDITTHVDPSMVESVDSAEGLQRRVIQRLENLVPQGDRAIKGDFQSV